jgi:hypothetical protein
MKMRQLWLFRICLCLTLFVAANRIFAFSDTNTKAKYTLQAQTAEDQEEDDVLLPATVPSWNFSTIEFKVFVGDAIRTQQNSRVLIPLFIRFRNLRL